MERSPELEALLRRLYAAMDAGDAESLARAQTEDGETFLAVGSDPLEVWDDPAVFADVIRAQVRETSDMRLAAVRVRAWAEEGMGWGFAEPVWEHPDGPVATRDTFVFHREAGTWRIVHSHVSIGVSNLERLGRELTTSVERIAATVSAERPDLRGAANEDGPVTIVFTDIQDSTVLTERLGDDAWLSVLRRHDDLVRRTVGAHGGIVVKHLGDGFMLAFRRAEGALGAVSEIQRAIREVRAEEVPIRVRAGVHAGDVIERADDFYGKTVVQAARIAGHAAGGQTLVSALVRELVRDHSDLAFRDVGEVRLKGLSEAVRLFALA